MRQYFGANAPLDMVVGLIGLRDELKEELGRDDFVFARVGWISALLQDANFNGDHGDASLWLQEALAQSTAH
jgi:hypothetical protein